MNVSILGAGTWGTALAMLYASNGHKVTVWSALPDEIEEMRTTRVHPKLPGVVIPPEIDFSVDLESACSEAHLVILVVPSAYARDTIRAAVVHIPHEAVIVSATKGLEAQTLLSMTAIITEEFAKEERSPQVVCLSGPTHAEEVSRSLPTAIVSASTDSDAAHFVQELTSNNFVRVYLNDDVLGVELCGAVKNVIALATGVSAGLGYGDNARAALITRGLAEMKRLGLSMGCKEATFDGLTGMGDLVVTCTSEHSRNNKAGRLIGKGLTAKQAVREVGMVVEGLSALPALVELAQREGVDMPIVNAVDDIVNRRIQAHEVLTRLLDRKERYE